VVKGEVCKTSIQRFESARRLHISLFILARPLAPTLIADSAALLGRHLLSAVIIEHVLALLGVSSWNSR
jgi:hypothetical protein